MKFRTSVATAVAATAAVLAVGAAPANAATTAARPTSLTLKASTNHAQYGQWVELTAHLGRTASNRTVEIDNGRSVVKKGHVDAHGNLTAWVKSAVNSWYTAKFTGDSRDKAARVGTWVTSAAVMHEWMTSSVYTGGQNPTIRGYVSPNKQGEYVHAHMQIWYQGAWQNLQLSPDSFKLGPHSEFQISTSGLWSGYSYRQAFTFNGDSQNTGTGYHWVYFKVA